ncbi:hypothetical protein QMY54_05824 [Pseudomonas rhodesiae]|nr:hypothetical protein QMY54_05824 [Pseudomonas rhodesiae]
MWEGRCDDSTCPSHIRSLSHSETSACQSARLLIALRNATNHFTSSCGSIGFALFIVYSLETQTPQP